MPHQKDVYHALHCAPVVYSDYKEGDLQGPLLRFYPMSANNLLSVNV